MTTTHEKQITTEEKGTYKLVKGDFSPDEASEITNELFFKKINFHTLKSFGNEIKFGIKDASTEQRINELKLAQSQAKELIAEAKKTGKSLRVNSTITIELI